MGGQSGRLPKAPKRLEGGGGGGAAMHNFQSQQFEDP